MFTIFTITFSPIKLIITPLLYGSAFGVYENHSWIRELFKVIKKLLILKYPY